MQRTATRIASILAATLLVVAVWSTPVACDAATGADMRKAEALATEAKVFFRSKLYKDAALQFMEAFALSSRPSLVYNAARAYQEGGLKEKSLALFHHYLSLTGVDAAGKKAAQARIATLKAQLADAAKKRQAAQAAESRRRQQRAAELARKTAAAQRAAAASIQLKADKNRVLAQQNRRNKEAVSASKVLIPRELDWTWAGASLGVVAVSAVTYSVALSYANALSASDVTGTATLRRYTSNRDTAVAWRAFAVGTGVIGISMAGWTALKWWRSAQSQQSTTWLLPVPTSQGWSVQAQLRF